MSHLDLLPVGFGGFVLLGALWDAWRGAGARDWPTTPGRIVRSTVTAQDDGDGGTQYGAEVAYEYAPAGIPRRGHRVCYGRTAGLARRGTAAAIAARYRVGTAVSVAYDPAEPDRSVLEPGLRVGDCLARVAFGVALIGFGASFGHWI